MKEGFICGTGTSDLGTDMVTMARAFSQATKTLSERAAYWVVLRQQRLLQKLSKKNHSSTTTFYIPLIQEEEEKENKVAAAAPEEFPAPKRGAKRPHLRSTSVRRWRKRLRLRNNNIFTCQNNYDLKKLINESYCESENDCLNQYKTSECVSLIVENKLYFLAESDGEIKVDRGEHLLNTNPYTVYTRIFLDKLSKMPNCPYGSYRRRKKTSKAKPNYRKRRKGYHEVSATPVVPPRTRSSQHHQNPGSFNPPFRKQQPYLNHNTSVAVQKNHEIISKNDFNSNKDNFSLSQVINAYPRQPLVKQSSSSMVGLTSTTNNTAQPPQSLHKPGNNFMLSKYSQPNSSIIPKTVKLPPPPSIPTVKNNLSAQHSMTTARVQQLPTTVSNVNGNNKNHSQILDLGNGKFVPMNRLYESLLDEPYFHPVVRNVLASLLTKDRMFLVRPSTHSKHPLTLSLLEKGKIFNISIRIRSDTKFALGTEKVGEMAFSSVGDIIEFYRNEPIKLEDGSLTYLKWSPPKENDYIQPE